MNAQLGQREGLKDGELLSVRLAWNISVEAELNIPDKATGLVVFAHGNGFCGEDTFELARMLQQNGIATLVFDLLTEEEAEFDEKTGLLSADAVTLGDRMVAATIWVEENRRLREFRLGLFADGIGATAAFVAAARLPQMVKAIVCRSGDLSAARSVVPYIKVPTLFLVSSDDEYRSTNEEVFENFAGVKSLKMVPNGKTLLKESAVLDKVGMLAVRWFEEHLREEEL